MANTNGPKNRLAKETSPYLQQHATNPVDWYAWGPEAFEEAREDRQTRAAVRGLLGLPLVPRDGARVLRGRGHRPGDERAVREHQGGSRRAAGHRQDLPVRAPGAHAARRRLAADHVPDARRPEALLRRHVFPEHRALRHAGVHHACCSAWPSTTASRPPNCARRTTR